MDKKPAKLWTFKITKAWVINGAGVSSAPSLVHVYGDSEKEAWGFIKDWAYESASLLPSQEHVFIAFLGPGDAQEYLKILYQSHLVMEDTVALLKKNGATPDEIADLQVRLGSLRTPFDLPSTMEVTSSSGFVSLPHTSRKKRAKV